MEVWRPIPGHVGFYEASDLGRVRSISRTVKCKGGVRFMRGRILAQNPVSDRYMMVSLSKRGRITNKSVHTLILEAFVGKRPARMEACHGVGGSFDNRVCNLRWDTIEANKADMIAHGTAMRGEKNGFSILTEAAVMEARLVFSAPRSARRPSHAEFGRRYGVSGTAVGDAVRRRTWRHIP